MCIWLFSSPPAFREKKKKERKEKKKGKKISNLMSNYWEGDDMCLFSLHIGTFSPVAIFDCK